MKGLVLFFSTLLFLSSSYVNAVSDRFAPLSKIEKVYSAPEPIGQLTITYNASSSREAASLAIDCELFSVSIPSEGIDDLPRPDWDTISVAYSFETDNSGNLTDTPYLSISLNLHGPIRQATWEQTWARFHINSTGKVTRYIKRRLPRNSFNMTRVIHEKWEIGQDVNVEAILEAAQSELE